LAKSHPSNEKTKGKCKEVLKETLRELEVEKEEQMEDKKIIILPYEGELLKLP